MDKGKSTSLRTQKGNKLIPRDINDALGKVPPSVPEVEESIIAGLLLEKDAINMALATSLKPDHFYDPRYEEVYRACLDLYAKARPIDMRTVVEQLKVNGKLEFIGGMIAIVEMTRAVSSAGNLEAHIRIVQEKFMRRQLIQIASGLHKEAYEDQTNIFDLIESTSSELFHLDIGRSSQRKMLDMITLMNQTIQNIQMKNVKGGLTGTPSGFSLLDRITSGWQKSDLILIAARAGSGKTAFMLSVCRTAAREIPTAIFSLEMSAIQLGERLISADNEIENDKIRSGLLSDIEWQRITADQTKLCSAKLYIDDTPAISISELRSKCLRLKQEKGIGLIVIDYLQLMKGIQTGNREQEIGSISRALKALAKELDVPVLALSQVSRAVETRADKRPILSDLRESGSLEMDADVVIFLYRPEYYKIYVDENGNSTAGVCEVDVAKHRNGGTGMVRIKFLKYFTKFVDFDTVELFPDAARAPKGGFISKHQYDPSEARNKDNEPPPITDEQPF